jgi:hypothetical protein
VERINFRDGIEGNVKNMLCPLYIESCMYKSVLGKINKLQKK